MDSITVACPIVYGSIAFYLGKKAEEFNTHRWSLYVRGPHLSIFIEKVAFTLHPSFEQQVRGGSGVPSHHRSYICMIAVH
eukprot:gene10725-11685_t